MRTLCLCLSIAALAALPGCQMNERLSGTVLGAVAGGAIGGVAGGVGGAAIGLAAGGVSGYLVGDYIADRRERGRANVFGNANTMPQATMPSATVMGVKEYGVNDAARLAYERGRAAQTAPEARAHYEESVRLDPSQPAPYNALGLNALHRGDRVEALRLFRAALAKDPSYYPAQHNLARLTRERD
jgi:tetratricopeptide (TPR) repeat protein